MMNQKQRKYVPNNEQHYGHNDNDENIQLKNNVLNLNIQSVSLGDIDSGPKQPKLQVNKN